MYFKFLPLFNFDCIAAKFYSFHHLSLYIFGFVFRFLGATESNSFDNIFSLVIVAGRLLSIEC